MRFIAIILILLMSSSAVATSCNPAPAGTIMYDGGALQYCDGAEWQPVVGSGEGVCASTDEGKVKFFDAAGLGTYLYYCDGSSWNRISDPSGKTGVGDACSVPGKTSIESGFPSYCGEDLTMYNWNINTGMSSISICSMYAAQGSCEADSTCVWDGMSCSTCACNRPSKKKK